MYTPGNILYFKPFFFPDGNSSKNKYFIVLKTGDEYSIIASLPTSKDHIPVTIEKKHGCIDAPEIQFNCYYLEANKPIAENGWGFPFDTYIYGTQIAEFNKANFDSIYSIEGIDYEIIGKLTNHEFKAIINCIKNSRTVSRKIRRIFGATV
jgi:hypothetical protein